MMKYLLGCLCCLMQAAFVWGQAVCPKEACGQFKGKDIYIPKDLQGMNLNDTASQWCWQRMCCTDNLAIFWEKGFGTNLDNPPKLDGQEMKVDLHNLSERLESFYTFFRDTLQFVKPGSLSDRYRMMVMLNYSLEGTAYGGDYDGRIGALWVAPNRIQDQKLNCMAHELGHSFQCQITADGQGEAWGGCGFFEMAAQWMLWQVNPDWQTDERYHWEAFTNLTHKAYLHLENIYHSPYVLEYWGMKRGRPVIAELFRQGKKGEDPVMTYKRMFGLTQEAFCDEMFDACRHFINWDFPRVWKESRPYANRYACKLVEAGKGYYRPDASQCPENYGFNAIPLTVPAPGQTVKVNFEGMRKAADRAEAGYTDVRSECAGWRYGFVGVTAEGKSIYGEMGTKAKGKLAFQAPEGEPLAYLWLVVMGAPTEHWMNPEPPAPGTDAQWPYRIRLKGTDWKVSE